MRSIFRLESVPGACTSCTSDSTLYSKVCFEVSADDSDFVNQPNIVHDISAGASQVTTMSTMKSSTYMDTLLYLGNPIPAYCGSGSNSFSYTITIGGVQLPTTGISHSLSGGVLTITINGPDPAVWATGSPHAGVITANSGHVAYFTVRFCYVAPPDPLFVTSLYQNINTGSFVYNVASLSEVDTSCSNTFSFNLATPNSDMTDNCTGQSTCSFTLNTDTAPSTYELPMTLTAYRSTSSSIAILQETFTVHVIDCNNSDGLAFAATAITDMSDSDNSPWVFDVTTPVSTTLKVQPITSIAFCGTVEW